MDRADMRGEPGGWNDPTALDRLLGRPGAVIRAEIRWRQGREVDGFVLQANLVRVRDVAAPAGSDESRPVVGVELSIQPPSLEGEGASVEWLLDLEEAREIADRIAVLCDQVGPVEEDSPLVTVTYAAREDLTLGVQLPLAEGSRAWHAFLRTPDWAADCDVAVLTEIRRQLQGALARAQPSVSAEGARG